MLSILSRNARISLLSLLAGAGAMVSTMLIVDVAKAAESIEVTVDHAKVMRVSKPASTIIIGNPGIADATVQDATTLIITGKSYGVTNMIILDEDGQPIADTLLTVRAEAVNAVTVYRRTERETFSCSPNCERSLALGDGATTFGEVQSQVEQRNSFAGADGGGQ